MTTGPFRRAAALVIASCLAVPACTGQPRPVPSSPPPSTSPSPVDTGTVARPTCPFENLKPREPRGRTGALPPAFAEVARDVEQVRGLRFKRSVPAQALSQQRIGQLVQQGLRRDFPRALAERREKAWQVLGAIPRSTDLLGALLDFVGSQVVGFYDPLSDRLVFAGTANPSPLQRLTLAHELTHALDDQLFDLGLLDDLGRRCLDEQAAALTALAEGDAQEMAFQWAQQNLTLDELVQIQTEASTFELPPASVPRFIRELLVFPYGAGQRFVGALLARGGTEALNEAFRDPPVSTEQILHPERYPDDEPLEIVVPDLAPALGEGWTDLDFLDVGEGWLQLLLALRLGEAQSVEAAAGWDGGQYRGWVSGDRVAVVLDTVWDTEGDAAGFGEAMEAFVLGTPASVIVSGSTVRTLFASDELTLGTLEEAAAQRPLATGA